MNEDEYIQKVWPEKRLNEYNYFSGWHEAIKDIIRETWSDAKILTRGEKVDNNDFSGAIKARFELQGMYLDELKESILSIHKSLGCLRGDLEGLKSMVDDHEKLNKRLKNKIFKDSE